MSILTRRGLVAAAPAAIAAAIMPAFSGQAPDAELLTLGAQLQAVDTAWAAFVIDQPDGDDGAFYDEHWRLRAAIDDLPATTPLGQRAKASAAKMARDHDPLGACSAPGSFQSLSRSLLDDILATSKGALNA